MPNYKDPKGELHFIEDKKHKKLLPAGCVEISDSEAEEIRISNQEPEAVAPDIAALWAEFDSATNTAKLKIVLEKLLNRS